VINSKLTSYLAPFPRYSLLERSKIAIFGYFFSSV